ncbi:MAG: hypothetical protein AAFY68_02370 [Pseudomonadota bacterium]
MRRVVHILSAFGLAMVLALTSAAMAVARAEMSLFGTVSFCQGAHIVEVKLGPDGRPMEADPICPDCAMGALALPEPTKLTTATPASRVMSSHGWQHLQPRQAVEAAAARGPPAQPFPALNRIS